MSGLVVSGFAGPGGWCTGLRWAGWTGRNIGVEIDSAACETARAAGHERVQGDVSLLDPAAVSGGQPVDGLVQSPPCPTFSDAGSGSGRRELDKLHALIRAFANGRTPDPVEWEDPRTPLTAEPMRWAAALNPQWIALEQVPPVLPIWQHMAILLRGRGYGAWVGVLNAADYGCAQVRRRAVLIARRGGSGVVPPRPTHGAHASGGLFGDVQPWVTMAEALGWCHTASGDETAWVHQRPATTVQGDPRIGRPGHKDRDGGETQFQKGAVRVSVAEAATLQSFPADYPWRGTKTQQYRQVGDAVPPLLAMHVLRPLLSGASGAEVAA